MYRSTRYLLRFMFCLVWLLPASWAPAQEQVSNNNKERLHYRDTAALLSRLNAAAALHDRYPDSAAVITEQALRQSYLLKYNLGIAFGRMLQGRLAQNRGQFDSSIYFFSQGLAYAKKGKMTTVNFYNNIANAYFFKGAYQTALENYTLALQQSRLGPADSSQVYLNIALIWNRIGANEQASFYLEQVAKIARRTADTLTLLKLYNLQSGISIAEKQIPKAKQQLEQALVLARGMKQEGEILSALNQLTHLSLDEHRVDKAMQYTQEALAVLKQYPGGFTFDRYHTQHNLGLIYRYLKNYHYAEQLLQETFASAEKIGLKDLILHMEPDLAAVYAQNGKNDLAYKHQLHYSATKDSILEDERKSMLQLWQQHIVAEKDKSLLAQQLQLSQQSKRLQLKNTWIAGSLLGTALLCLIFALWARSYRRKQRLQEELVLRMEQSVQIDQLKAQVKGEEQERNRLALELHDGIASQLWAIRLNVESVQQSAHIDNREQLANIYQQLDETTQEIRKTAHNLMPDLLLQYGLTAALESLAGKLNAGAGLEVVFQEYGIIPRMHEDIELSLYRMIQELIQNVLKHADGVSQLLLQLSCNQDVLSITIEDNGSGFFIDKLQRKGIGLQNIAHRVKTLGGHFDIQSSPGKGTTVYLEFEIHNLL